MTGERVKSMKCIYFQPVSCL